jgi:hypothetical protein
LPGDGFDESALIGFHSGHSWGITRVTQWWVCNVLTPSGDNCHAHSISTPREYPCPFTLGRFGLTCFASA